MTAKLEKRWWEQQVPVLLDRLKTHPAHLACLGCKLVHAVTARELVIRCGVCGWVTLYRESVLFFMWTSLTWVLASRAEAQFSPYREALRFATAGPRVHENTITSVTRGDSALRLDTWPVSWPVDLLRWRRR